MNDADACTGSIIVELLLICRLLEAMKDTRTCCPCNIMQIFTFQMIFHAVARTAKIKRADS